MYGKYGLLSEGNNFAQLAVDIVGCDWLSVCPKLAVRMPNWLSIVEGVGSVEEGGGV